MRKLHLTSFLAVAVTCLALSQSAMALSPAHYARNSKLANGKWIKIKVANTGVHEITAEELSEMGFSNPDNVRIYGSGGQLIGEVLNGDAPDDLVSVPVWRSANKICFYAKGPVNFQLEDPRTTKPHYSRTINPYATEGCYFLCEGSSDDTVKKVAVKEPGANARPTSLDYFYHEKEEVSVGYTGKSLLGERISESNNSFDFEIPGAVPGSSVTFNPCVAARIAREGSGYSNSANLKTYVEMGGTTDTIGYTSSSSAIRYSENSLIFYNSANPSGAIVPTTHSEKGKIIFDFSVPSDLSMKWARLDWFTVTFEHQNNLLNASNGQVRMGFDKLSADDRIELPNATDGIVVWNIDDTGNPVEFQYADYSAPDATTVKAFTPGYESEWGQFVAFDPSATLYKITGFEAVENQDIHGMSTPDMVIVTSKELKSQAERVAKMHRNKDGFTVHVVDQEEVFNEFSSGTPDAMAIRLMNKMFYDRDQRRFKYLLMFGCGSFDNRGITTNKKNRLITYQSDNSNDENNSYVSDDFFGVLTDNSGYNITSEALTIGVGRIPSANEAEARSDVDKLLNYVNDPDYGVWRNNALITSDEGDSNKHLFQAVGMEEILNTDLKTGLFVDKAYIDLFPNATTTSEPGVAASNLTAVEARRHIIEALKQGQYFYTYIGHAGTISYTKSRHMWTMIEAQNTEYDHLPIFTTACCDVARYDSDERGIAEVQFHKKNGGAIALFTTPRSVFSDNNDKANRAWANAMFSFMNTKEMPRLGDIYVKAKQTFGSSSIPDKVKYLLLGDPAMQVNYPKPLVKITEINGVALTEDAKVKVRPLQELKVKAQVNTLEGGIDTEFNGDAVLTLYDQERFYKDIKSTFNGRSTTRSVYYPRNQIAQVKGRVVNGMFEGTVLVPRYVEALWADGLVSVYAHKDNSEHMVNGQNGQVELVPYSETDPKNVNDDVAPVVEKMFFNDESNFAEGAYIPANSTLYITATDNEALSNMSVGIGNAMTLKLDNGKETYREVLSHATLSENGKQMDIALPMTGLTYGQHRLTYTVHDAAGNEASRTITFLVGPASKVSLYTEEIPAVDKATFNIESELNESPMMTLKVTDAAGNLVWTKKTSEFPCVWDLKDKNGTKLAPGLYRYFGTYETASEYGGTEINKLIVIDEYKHASK
ncbi:MAG: type IX secretion system sortase PorU [Bacteroidales bacterium]|nr:type IX secretion system sortase PorU [Bacteroidales bacterium]